MPLLSNPGPRWRKQRHAPALPHIAPACMPKLHATTGCQH